MISFEAFRSVEGMPIYLQMIRFVKQGLAAGRFLDGDELPSRRLVSATLAVNPNTVQKAYRQLEEEGLIQSRPGAGSHITASPQQVEDIRLIERKAGFESLSEGLEEIARLRLQYPEATLKELGMMLNPQVGKSGVNHRLRKLSTLADDLRERKEESYYD